MHVNALVQQNSSYKGSGGLTQKMRRKLVSAARSAIRMRSKEPDPKKALRLLIEDLINGPCHCFGDHTLCSTDFCTNARERASSSGVHTEEETEETEAEGGNFIGMLVLHKKIKKYPGCIMYSFRDHQRVWRETVADDPQTDRESRQGGPCPLLSTQNSTMRSK